MDHPYRTDDLKSFKNSVQGLGLTYGYDLQAGRIANRDGEYFLVVSYVCADSPARKAGLKRGDIIITLDGKAIAQENIYDAFNSYSIDLGVTNLDGDHIGSDVRNVSLKAVDMYENPVLVTKTFDVSDANPGMSKVYAIVTGGSASASEGLIVGLRPYLDVVLVGRQTYGKYCAGILLAPEDFYNSKYDYSLIKDWEMYVMISKFADRDGNNASIPDGIPVDVEVEDDPFDGCQLGDENETMLRAALQAAGKVYPAVASSRQQTYSLNIPLPPLDHGAPRGLLIKTDIPSVK